MELPYDIVDHDLDLDKTENESAGDDIIYSELERRILVLINVSGESDSEDSRMMRRTCNYSSHQDQNYFDWTQTENPPSSVPTTIMNLWKSNNVNGTGVFIPHLVKESNRRNKPRMFFFLCFSRAFIYTYLHTYIMHPYTWFLILELRDIDGYKLFYAGGRNMRIGGEITMQKQWRIRIK